MVVEALEVAVDARSQRVCSNIELPPIVEQWIVNILLDNTSSLACPCAFNNDRFDLAKFFCDLNALATVGILTRFDDPHVQLSGIHSVFIVVAKLLEVDVSDAFFHMEGHRQRIKWVLMHCLVIHFHIDEQGFFVT